MKKLGILFLVGYLTSNGVAHAATYYVAKTGDNSNSCQQATSTSTSKLTIEGALGCLAAGDTLLVRAGTYVESLKDTVPSGTSWSTKVRIAAYPAETVWLRPTSDAGVVYFAAAQYVELDGINIDGSNNLPSTVNLRGGSNHIRIQNAEIIGSPTSGWCAAICGGMNSEFIRLIIHGGGPGGGCGGPCSSLGIYTGGDNNLIDSCDFYDTSLGAIQIYHGSDLGSASNNVIRNNRIHDIRRSGDPAPQRLWGIVIGSGSNNQVYNNLIYNVGVNGGAGQNAGIYVYSASGTAISNNTIYNVIGSGVYIDGPSSGSQVRNNIVYIQTGTAYVDGGTGTTQSNNMSGTNPLFVNPGSSNFQLQAASPAVNAGVSVVSVSTDMDGVSRPQGGAPDLGAYEYSAQQASSPQSAPPAPPKGVKVLSN